MVKQGSAAVPLYSSYRIAEVKNVAQVTLEAGNSPSIISKHYRVV